MVENKANAAGCLFGDGPSGVARKETAPPKGSPSAMTQHSMRSIPVYPCLSLRAAIVNARLKAWLRATASPSGGALR